MADCFWTDFVKCAEDCGAAPVVGPAVLLGLGAAMGSGGSGSGDAIPYFPETGVRVSGPLQFDTVDVYMTSGDVGCSWVGFMATTDAGMAGTTIADVYDPGGNQTGSPLTWKLVDDFAKTPFANGTNIALGAATDGLGGSVINTNDLLTALGASGYDNAGLLIVATLRNTSTNETWEATWALDTCF